MKIGILTYHKSINYGAFMQCYSLFHRLRKDFPSCDTEIIDYCPETVRRLYDVSVPHILFGSLTEKELSYTIRAKKLLKTVLQIIKSPDAIRHLKKRKQTFESAQKYLVRSPSVLYSDDENTFINWVNSLNYDVIIVGSDCVWEWKLLGFPNAYLLNKKIKAAKFSYAASSDRIYYGNTSDTQYAYLKDILSNFNYIGVRDISTENLIAHTDASLHYFHNCDPTFLLDMDELYKTHLESAKKKLQDAGVDLSKKIIGVMANGKLALLAAELFGSEYQLVSIYSFNACCHYHLDNLSPLEWAVIFKFFSLTITNFFHGTMLSLKNGTPTMTFDYWHSDAEDHPTKIDDLYRRLNFKRPHYFKAKDSYSSEEINDIRATGISFINNPNTEEIALALEKEAASYTTFHNALTEFIKQYEN